MQVRSLDELMEADSLATTEDVARMAGMGVASSEEIRSLRVDENAVRRLRQSESNKRQRSKSKQKTMYRETDVESRFLNG